MSILKIVGGVVCLGFAGLCVMAGSLPQYGRTQRASERDSKEALVWAALGAAVGVGLLVWA